MVYSGLYEGRHIVTFLSHVVTNVCLSVVAAKRTVSVKMLSTLCELYSERGGDVGSDSRRMSVKHFRLWGKKLLVFLQRRKLGL